MYGATGGYPITILSLPHLQSSPHSSSVNETLSVNERALTVKRFFGNNCCRESLREIEGGDDFAEKFDFTRVVHNSI